MTSDPNTPSSTRRAIDTSRLTTEEIESLLIDGQRDFSGTNWMGIDFDELTNWELDGINFTKACLLGITTRSLTNSILIDADVRNACFVMAYLDNTDFTGANLEGVNFRGANLNGVNFTSTCLNNANLAFADLTGAKGINFPLPGRGLTRANILLWQTTFPDGTIFPGPFLTTGYTSDLLREVNR